MKIFTFADLHGAFKELKKLKRRAKKADIVVCAGDVSIFEENLEKILSEINKFKPKILMIHGNHEEKMNMKKKCKKYKNIEFIHNKKYNLDDITFLGYGGGGFEKKDKKFEKAMKKFKKLKKKKFVLVTHAPPYNTKIDKLMEGHCGNESIRRFIEKTKPVLAISGHLHETEGISDKIGKTKIINPGYKGKMITL